MQDTEPEATQAIKNQAYREAKEAEEGKSKLAAAGILEEHFPKQLISVGGETEWGRSVLPLVSRQEVRC